MLQQAPQRDNDTRAEVAGDDSHENSSESKPESKGSEIDLGHPVLIIGGEHNGYSGYVKSKGRLIWRVRSDQLGRTLYVEHQFLRPDRRQRRSDAVTRANACHRRPSREDTESSDDDREATDPEITRLRRRYHRNPGQSARDVIEAHSTPSYKFLRYSTGGTRTTKRTIGQVASVWLLFSPF